MKSSRCCCWSLQLCPAERNKRFNSHLPCELWNTRVHCPKVDDAPVPYKNASTIDFNDGIHTCHKRRLCRLCDMFLRLDPSNQRVSLARSVWHCVAHGPARFQTTNMTFHTGEPCDPRPVSLVCKLEEKAKHETVQGICFCRKSLGLLFLNRRLNFDRERPHAKNSCKQVPCLCQEQPGRHCGQHSFPSLHAGTPCKK